MGPPRSIRASERVTVVMTLSQLGPGRGLEVTPTVTGTRSRPHVSALENWCVRFVGVWLQFISGQRSDGLEARRHFPRLRSRDNRRGSHPRRRHRDVRHLLGIFTILGFRPGRGSRLPSFNVPASTSTVRILASGRRNGVELPDTLEAGAAMTGLVNYGMTSLLCAMGAAAPSVGLIMKEVVDFASRLGPGADCRFQRPVQHTERVLRRVLSSACSGNRQVRAQEAPASSSRRRVDRASGGRGGHRVRPHLRWIFAGHLGIGWSGHGCSTTIEIAEFP